MSRGFVKEDDQEEAPMIPPRAALPEGSINYVTPLGNQQLLEERRQLEIDRKELPHENETERRRAAAVIDGKLNLLQERIVSAQILDPKDQPKDIVRFGATVKFKMNGNQQEFQIVGVDEADVKKKKIAFVSPIAKALTGNKPGEKTTFKLGAEERAVEIVSVKY